MVDKKELRVIILFVALFAFLLFSTNFVSAAMAGGNVSLNPGSLARFGNYSTTINFSITTSMINTSTDYDSGYNATLYCNYTGGAVTKTGVDIINVFTLYNGTDGNSTTGNKIGVLENSSVRISFIAPVNESLIFNCSVWAANNTDQNWSQGNPLYRPLNMSNVTFDSTPPNVSALLTEINYGNYTGTLTLNISANDLTTGVHSVHFNITYSNGSQVNYSIATGSGGYYSKSIDTLTFDDGAYNVTVEVNDTTLNNFNKSRKFYLTFDKLSPTGSFNCAPSTVNTGDVVTCSCAVSDATAGVNSSYTTFTANPSTTDTGGFTTYCSIADMAGNTATLSATYTVEMASSSSSGGGGGDSGTTTVTAVDEQTHVLPEITPEAPVTISSFEDITAIEELNIEVSEAVDNARVVVRAYDETPLDVELVRVGEVHKYIQIETQNLESNLAKATLTVKVRKTWLSSKSVDRANMAVFKLDESAEQWNELSTVYKNEDEMYYYYDVEVTSFSYFAIAEKTLEEEPATEPEEPEAKSLTWLWIVLGAVVVALVVGGVIMAKKKR